MAIKKVKDLKPGDYVRCDDGKFRLVKSVSPFGRGSRWVEVAGKADASGSYSNQTEVEVRE